MLSTGQHPSGQFVLDEYAVSYHGLAHTHMDTLCHMAWNGKMYNGFPQTDVSEGGAEELAITNYKNGIFTRGVLFDVPRLKGKQWLEPGDVVFIRTGRWARRAAKGAWNTSRVAGLYASCAPWLKKHDVAMVGSDSDTDVMPSGIERVVQPMHQLLLVAMGTPIFDNCDLEALGDAAAKRNRWIFLVSAAPIPVNGGTGSPLNPIATF
jgi:kynurenine formamidase